MPEATHVRGSVKETLLAHDLRREIYETVQERPGLNKNQLANRLDVYTTQLTYHVDRLVVNGLLEEVSGLQGREMLLFHPSQTDLWEDSRTRILFGREPVRQVGLFVADHTAVTSREIADATDRTRATARHHLRTLREHDLTKAIRTGSETTYHCTEPLERWAEKVGDCYERAWESPDEA